MAISSNMWISLRFTQCYTAGMHPVSVTVEISVFQMDLLQTNEHEQCACPESFHILISFFELGLNPPKWSSHPNPNDVAIQNRVSQPLGHGLCQIFNPM